MDPDMKAGIDALGAKLNATADTYKSPPEKSVNDAPGVLQAVRDGWSGSKSSGVENLTDQLGSMLDPGTFGENAREIAGSIVPDFIEGVSNGFMGQWGLIIIVLIFMRIARLIYVSFLGSIDYKGIISLGNPGPLKLLVFAAGLFALAGYAGYYMKRLEADTNALGPLAIQHSYFRK